MRHRSHERPHETHAVDHTPTRSDEATPSGAYRQAPTALGPTQRDRRTRTDEDPGVQDDSLLEVHNLRTDISTHHGDVHAVAGVSFHIDAGETLGLVGESGCGKTMTAMSLVRLLPHGGKIVDGSVRFDGRELTTLAERQLRAVRGDHIGIIFQDPMTSLNPTMTIGHQISETVRVHHGVTRRVVTARAADVLGMVGMPRPSERMDDYPHQLSGGMRQRAMIAIALACEPKLLIADEPTTALDVTIQAQILALLDDLRERLEMGLLLVTHDMGVIAEHADRVLVMYAGKAVESATTTDLFFNPRHRYTRALMQSMPTLDQDRSQRLHAIPGLPPNLIHPPEGCRFAPRCAYATDECRAAEPILEGQSRGHLFACFHPWQVHSTVHADIAGQRRVTSETASRQEVLVSIENVSRRYPTGAGVFRRSGESVKAVTEVTFSVRRGETFGLVGESGCGKSTLGRLIVGMERPDDGVIAIDGTASRSLSRVQQRQRRRDVQLVFQDSYSAMNPKMRIGAIIRDPLRVQRIGTRPQRKARVAALLDSVALPQGVIDRYPHEISGGQRQRVGLARALALEPKLIVADEPVSALDVSVQAQILNLMESLQEQFGLTYIVISHDLSVVRYLADRIGVMYLGRLVEIGPADAVYNSPAHPYTAGLLAAIPAPNPNQHRVKGGTAIGGELPSAIHPPSGCPFRTRCPRAQDRCATEAPAMRRFGPGQYAACHFPLIPLAENEQQADTIHESGIVR